jgi:tetratricopeptide (TPR) repeat protein
VRERLDGGCSAMRRRAHRWGWMGVVLGACAVAFSQAADPLQPARVLVAEGRMAEAEVEVRREIAQNASSAKAHFLLGYVLFREQKARESLAAYTEGAKWQRPGPEELRVVASDYVLLNDLADADKWFTAVTVEKPDDAEAWYLLGRTKYNENRFEESIACFERVLALSPKDVRAADNLGLAQEGLGRTKEAKAAFEHAIAWQAANPADAQPYLNLGNLLMTEGDAAGALQTLIKAAALAPENPKAHEQLGRAYEGKGDLAGAQRELEQAVRLAPNASALHFKLGQVYRRRGLTKEAEQEFGICSRLNGARSSTEVPNPYQRAEPVAIGPAGTAPPQP